MDLWSLGKVSSYTCVCMLMCGYTQNACLFHQLSRLGAPLGFAAAYGKWERICKAHKNTGINPGKGDMPVAQECVMPISKGSKTPHLTFV